MVTSVNPADQLAALIRVQVASLRQRPAGPASAGRTSKAPATADAPDLAGVLAQRIQSIDPDDPEGERKAMKIFLETVLLSEFGQEMVNDPAFHLMVDQVQSQMENDPALAASTQEAARVLLKKNPA